MEGNNTISSMKLASEGKAMAFATDKANKCTYAAMKEKSAQLALQVYQQYFHLYKPLKYTHLDLHVAYAFSMARKKKTPFKVLFRLRLAHIYCLQWVIMAVSDSRSTILS